MGGFAVLGGGLLMVSVETMGSFWPGINPFGAVCVCVCVGGL